MEEGAWTAEFDYSADRFFATTAEIAELCGTSGEEEGFEASEVERFFSMITFLKEWRNFYYESKTVDFTYESGPSEVKDGRKGINLPQFSSAATPKVEHSPDETGPSNCNDFVLHAGGPVWGLDWCPMTVKKSDTNIKCEYLAVAAHPPGSAYHKIGVPLTGRGIIQIWCLLCTDKDMKISPPMSSGRRRAKKMRVGEESLHGFGSKIEESTVIRPRGRPRKKPIEEEQQSVSNAEEKVAKPRGRPRKKLCLSVDGAKEASLVRPRGRPRKQPTPSIAVLNGENESPPCTNSLTSGADESVLPSSVELGEFVPLLPASTHLNGEEKLFVKKCRGRPRKKPVQNTNEFAPNKNECPPSSGVELGKDASPLPALRELGNPDRITQNIVLEEAASELPVSGELTGKYESCLPSDRCKSRKKLVPTENEGALVSNIELGDDASALFTSGGLEYLSSRGLSIEKVPPASPASVDLNVKEGTTRRRRGRPKKKLAPNLSEHVPVSGAEFGKDVHIPPPPLVPDNFSPQVVGIDLEEVPLALCASDKKQSPVSKHSERSKMEIVLSDCTRDSAVLSGEDASSLPNSTVLEISGETCFDLVPKEFSFASPTSTDINVRKESSVPRRRWRPRKKSASVVNKHVPCSHHALNELSTVVLPEQLENDSSAIFHREDGSTMETSVRRNNCHCAVELDQTSDAGKKIDNKQRGIATTNSCYPFSPTTKEKKNFSATAELSYDAPHHTAMVLRDEAEQNRIRTVDASSSVIPNGIALPRIVLCLAHNGKVAWDVKWRPFAVDYSEHKYHMGYIAVLLGNGSLEVWEVPHLSMVKTLYASSSNDSTDPRFLKLKPVFKCSKVKCGDRQSIPLTVEWSPSANPDLLLAGFHDGTVAIWKFSVHNSSQDTNPLVCFTADSVPIRALAWAPDESDVESANLIMTAGHEGLKIWDIRDPYRPLWDLNPVQRVILSLDWLKDPRNLLNICWSLIQEVPCCLHIRHGYGCPIPASQKSSKRHTCIILSFDDGTLRTISLWNAACDVPVTGKPYVATKQLGMHSYQCSAFAIWSIQVSRTTGIIAYCGADGRVAHFQVTSQSVDKDAKRYRQPHFLCGALVEEGQTLKIRTPLPNTPLPEISFATKKSSSECGEAPRTISSYLADMNQTLANTDFPVLASGNPQTSRRKASSKPPRGSVKNQPKQNSRPASDEQFVPPGEAEEGTLQITETKDGEKERKIEVLPPKIIAMHRVRWNMNKGCETWLCYGGAAGIVRCQEIALPAVP